MPNPALNRQILRQYPTPKIADVIIREPADTLRLPIPAYGTAHPDTTKYPGFKFVYLRYVEDQGHWYEFVYAADRSDQDDYNYSLEYIGGNPRHPRITRTFIVPRGTAPIELGTADTGSVFSTFSYYLTDTGGYYTSGGDRYGVSDSVTGVLVAQSERPISGEIGSVYVEQTRIYEVIPGSDDEEAGSGLTQADGGYTVTRPVEDKNFVLVTWRLILPRLIADGYRPSPLSACPIPGYENLVLIDEVIQASDEDNQKSSLTRIYRGNISAADVHPGPAVVSSDKELPGVFPPEKYLEVVLTQESVVDIVNPSSENLNTPTAPAGYTLLAVKVAANGTVTGKRATVSKYYSVIRTLSGSQWDDNLRDYVPYTTTVMTPANAALAISGAAPGTEVTVTPYSTYWSIVTVESPNTTAITDTSRKFASSMPFTWPAVLTSFQYGFIGRKYPRGGSVAYQEFYYNYRTKKQWSGICKAETTIAWSPTAPLVIPTLEYMTPEAVQIDWPDISISIPPTLHGADLFSGTTGTEHPDYEYLTFSESVPATNYTDWPDSLTVTFDVRPYKGGFLQRKVVVFKPAV